MPDRRDQGQVQLRMRPGSAYMEVWSYDRHQLVLRFIDEMGYKVFRLTGDSQYALMTALREEKLRWGAKQDDETGLQFDVKYNKGALTLTVPLKDLQVDHQGDTVIIPFNVNVTVYLKYKKIDNFKKEQIVRSNQEEILKQKNLTFTIPYPLQEKGRYHFDIVLEHKLSSQKYRRLLKVKN
jgi:hypothetical protein